MKRFFITGIGTDIGKTVASAVIVKALGSDYWKPVQAGSLEFTDTHRVQQLSDLPDNHFHREAYRLQMAASPHKAAAHEGLHIDIASLKLPQTSNHLVIEGAGGLLVPLNDNTTIADWLQQLDIPVILVSRHYLGSLNHTLLSLEVLHQRKIPVAGIIFNGTDPESERIISLLGHTPVIGSIPEMNPVDTQAVTHAAMQLQPALQALAGN